MIENTIVSLATARGRGAIAIVRLSGSDSIEIAHKITHKNNFTPRVATLCDLFDEKNDLLDEALVLYFENPRSFTGEDIVEFQLHGGDVVAMMVIDALLYYGAIPAMPGEFTKRAFINGKIDLTKAESIGKLIDAKSKEGAKLLARQLKGELGDFVNAHRATLIHALAHSEVMIDYADEDLPESLLQTLQNDLLSVKDALAETLSSSENRDGFFTGYKVAIVGKPNVGKSSLLNKLLQFNRAIVSDIEGTTRDMIEEEFRIGSHVVKIVDTAGIRTSSDTIEKIGIEYSKNMIEEADVVIAIFDGSRKIDENDMKIISLLDTIREEKALITLLNKSDLSPIFDTKILDESNLLQVSCMKSLSLLKERLDSELNKLSGSDEQILISKRQINAVRHTTQAIESAIIPLMVGELEFFSFHLGEAIEYISTITKPYAHDEMLDEMFSNFCLGK
jgi:tRNA modification GTPase